MRLVYLFSLCLILGTICSQIFDLSQFYGQLSFCSEVALAYILMEVGLECVITKRYWKDYLKDFWIAATAAGLPWVFCFIYLLIRMGQPWQETLFISLFAAPTSSGMLFSMLASAGLGTTWLFRKVRILAIFDDIDTLLFLILLQFLFTKVTELHLPLIGLIFTITLLVIAWRYHHQIKLPSGRGWLFCYAILLTWLMQMVDVGFYLEIEILLPAFIWGALLYNPHISDHSKGHYHEHAYLEPTKKGPMILDRSIKIAFMFLVGLLLPKILFHSVSIPHLITDVLILTVLLILGKCVPIFCYQKEATLKERIGVAISMCARGELGKAVLILTIAKGVSGYSTTIAGLSLTLNLLLTGGFVAIASRLAKSHVKRI